MATLVDDVIAGAPVVITFIAGANIKAGQVVGMDVSTSPAAMTVIPITKGDNGNIPVGVAIDSRKDKDDVPVAIPPSIVRVRNESEGGALKTGEYAGLAETTAGEVKSWNESEATIIVGQILEPIAEGYTGKIRLIGV